MTIIIKYLFGKGQCINRKINIIIIPNLFNEFKILNIFLLWYLFSK